MLRAEGLGGAQKQSTDAEYVDIDVSKGTVNVQGAGISMVLYAMILVSNQSCMNPVSTIKRTKMMN